MRVAFFYTMIGDAERVADVAPRHAAYWNGLQLPEYLGGPFRDRSGGLITFDAASLEAGEALVANDPFVEEGVLASFFVRDWVAGNGDRPT